jgi:SAM-dependent methyltransferase
VEQIVGLGPAVIALYRQLKSLGLFDEVLQVMELGSQNIWCPHTTMVKDLFTAFGRPVPPEMILQGFANWTGSARDLYEGLGFKYNCVDTDGKFDALILDINFDAVPPDEKNKYDLVTNHGTTEHLINQLNAFKMIHDYTKPGGLMLHALPFLGQVDHGFFNYHPILFDALASYNSYQTLGMWVGIDWQLSSLIPWDPKLLEFLVLSPKSTGLLIVLQRKMYPAEFQVPFQGRFEQTQTRDVSLRYAFVVDGEVYDGRRDKFVTSVWMRRLQR